MASRWHLLFDFETMNDCARRAPAVDLSAVVFDWDRFTSDEPYGLDDLSLVRRFKVSVQNQVQEYPDFEISESTLQFWSRQSPEVRAKIKPLPTDLDVETFVSSFLEYLTEFPRVDYWWSRSNMFDPTILEHLFDVVGKKAHMYEYLKHWRLRDVRTYIDAKFNFSTLNGFVPLRDEALWNRVFKQHDSSWDVLADLLRFQAIVRAENNLEQV